MLGDNQFLTFQLTMLAHIEGIDGGSPRVDVTADASFLEVPPGMSVVNTYGYGSDVLDAPEEVARVAVLRARAQGDGRQVVLAGVAPGAAGADIAVFDLLGRRLAETNVLGTASGQAELVLPEPLISGIYFARCVDAQGVRSTRFALVR